MKKIILSLLVLIVHYNGVHAMELEEEPMRQFAFPLHEAVRNGDADLVKIILAMTLNVNEKCNGKTPLDLAKGRAVKKLLKDAGGVRTGSDCAVM